MASATDDRLIAAARTASENFSAGMPNFLPDQSTKRYYSAEFASTWAPIDEVGAEELGNEVRLAYGI